MGLKLQCPLSSEKKLTNDSRLTRHDGQTKGVGKGTKVAKEGQQRDKGRKGRPAKVAIAPNARLPMLPMSQCPPSNAPNVPMPTPNVWPVVTFQARPPKTFGIPI